MGIARSIECKTVADQPFPEVGSPDKTCRDRTPILVCGNRRATHWTSGDENIEFVGRLGAAAIQIAVGTPAQLIAFRRVDTPKPDPGSMYVQRITIDDTGLSDKICSGGRPGQEQEREDEGSALAHDHVSSGQRRLRGSNWGQFSSRSYDGRRAGARAVMRVEHNPESCAADFPTNAERVCAETILKR